MDAELPDQLQPKLKLSRSGRRLRYFPRGCYQGTYRIENIRRRGWQEIGSVRDVECLGPKLNVEVLLYESVFNDGEINVVQPRSDHRIPA